MSVTSATAARRQTADSQETSPPVLFVIDDDAGVMNALRDDLSRRFGKDFRVVAESSAATGLAVPARDIGPGRFRGGRRPVAVDQAGGLRRR